ncbi:MAG: transglutaminase-like domain-containing protein [archaeon]
MEEEIEEKKKSPLIYFIAVFLVLLLVLMIFPTYIVKLDPRPERIPTFEEVFLFEKNLSTETKTLKSREDFLDFVVPNDPKIKTTANRIVSIACSGEKICNAKAIYYFVRDNFDYISDPVNFEYVELPEDFMISGGGDCESGTLLMANLMEAVGINAELVFIPSHAFLRIRMPEAMQKYKLDEQWIYLDWTCKNCQFGEIPINNINAEKQFLEVN